MNVTEFSQFEKTKGVKDLQRKEKFMKIFSSLLALMLVFSMLLPTHIAASYENQVTQLKKNIPSKETLELKSAVTDQLEVLEGQPKLHQELQGLSGNQSVPVIIHLSEKPVALEMGIKKLTGGELSQTEEQTIRKQLKAQQNFFKKQMQLQKITYEEIFSYDTVLNGFSAKVQAKDLEKLLKLEGVKLIEPDAEVYASESLKGFPNKNLNDKFDQITGNQKDELEPMMNTSNSFLEIEKLWSEGYEGQGVKVAVLDTGIDPDHPDFKGIYKGGKNFVPHTGNDYARSRADDDASETSPKDRPAHRPEFNDRGSSFYTSHGTHVAGTIAAIGSNEYGVKGIAPKVDLYAYRVLGAYGSGATSGIIAAIEEAVEQEMDVINLSLGGGSNTETDSGSFAINNAMLAGTIGVIATGNSGPNRGTMGTPSTARLGIAVGNSTNPETMYRAEVNVQAGDFTYGKQLNLMATTFGKNVAGQLEGEFEVVAVPGIGNLSDFEGLDVEGKVALISRGDIAFVDKIINAKSKGAVATIIHNFAGGTNAPGISDVYLGDDFDFLPSFDMSQTDGEAIRQALQNGSATVSFGNIESTTTLGDEMNESSSRGPSTPNFDIKPDIVAPGTNIMSTIPMYQADYPEATYDTAYSRKTGTSMATPHIAGIVALMKQANPDWDAFDIKVALSNTGKVLNTATYDVFDQGAGRVQPYEAVHANVLAYAIDTANNDGEEVENVKGTITFGPQSLDEDASVTKQVIVKNGGQDAEVTVDVLKSFKDAKLTVTKEPISNGEQVLNITLTASKSATAAGDEFLGYVNIHANGEAISLPFAADFSGEVPTEVKNMAITKTDLSFAEDVDVEEAVLSFTITDHVLTNLIELWDLQDPEGGYYEDGYIGYLHGADSLAAGSYTLKIGGQYLPWDPGSTPQQIPDGVYTIDFSALTLNGSPPVISDYVGPVIVKSTKPEIFGQVENNHVTGQVVDQYFEFNEVLAQYQLGFDINEKLKASYIITKDSQKESPVAFDLNKDGTFEFDLNTANVTEVTVQIEDAAGNFAESVIFEGVNETVEYVVSHDQLALEIGETAQLTVTEKTTVDGVTTETDVTQEAVFETANEEIIAVENGQVTALSAGTTAITISYGDFTTTVDVEVTKPKENEEIVTYSVSKKELKLGVNQQEQLIVTQKTVKPDGTIVKKDVTNDGRYNVVNNKIATVHKGLVTAHQPGKTQVRVMIPGEDTILVYLEVEELPQDIVSYKVNKKDMTLGVGQQEQLIVTKIVEKVDGTTVETDMTPQTRFNVVNNTIAKVNKGLVTAHQAGKTQVRVMIPGEDTIFVYLTVENVAQDLVNYEISETNVTMEKGSQKQLTVTEVTMKPNGQIVENDVTIGTTFKVVDNTIATVRNGLLTAHKAGKTQVLVTIPNEETTFVYLEVTGEAEQPGDGGENPGEGEQPEVSEEKSYVLTEAEIEVYLQDKKAKEIIVNVPKFDRETAVEVSQELATVIEKAKKNLVFSYEGAQYTMKKSDWKKLLKEAQDAVTITFNVSEAVGVENAISKTFTIEIEKGIGKATAELPKFKAKMDVELPIVLEKLENSKKVAVYDAKSNTKIKAKYKKDLFTFDVKATGSFTAIND